MIFGQDRIHSDPDLGDLHYRRGAWRGEIRMTDTRAIPLAVPGGKSGPNPEALVLARKVPVDVHNAQKTIDAAFAEEYPDPNRDGSPEPEFVQIETIDRRMMIELGYRLAGDDDHTIGARLANGSLFELNGSIVPL